MMRTSCCGSWALVVGGVLLASTAYAGPTDVADAAKRGDRTGVLTALARKAEVNAAQMRSADLTTRFAAGEPMDVHQVMIASQEAGVMLDLALQVRNKIVEAYQEILRVNV